MTSLNLFSTRFDQVMSFVEKRASTLEYDTTTSGEWAREEKEGVVRDRAGSRGMFTWRFTNLTSVIFSWTRQGKLKFLRGLRAEQLSQS